MFSDSRSRRAASHNAVSVSNSQGSGSVKDQPPSDDDKLSRISQLSVLYSNPNDEVARGWFPYTVEVDVRNSQGEPVEGVPIEFCPKGDGDTEPTVVQTNKSGRATSLWGVTSTGPKRLLIVAQTRRDALRNEIKKWATHFTPDWEDPSECRDIILSISDDSEAPDRFEDYSVEIRHRPYVDSLFIAPGNRSLAIHWTPESDGFSGRC